MSKSERKAPTATRAHLSIALIVVVLFLFPFVAKFGFGNEPWHEVLFGNNRVFLFWAVGYGALLAGVFWTDRHPEKTPSWWHKPLG